MNRILHRIFLTSSLYHVHPDGTYGETRLFWRQEGLCTFSLPPIRWVFWNHLPILCPISVCENLVCICETSCEDRLWDEVAAVMCDRVGSAIVIANIPAL